MSKRNTRLRITRLAAATAIVAGASLTVAGVARAVTADASVSAAPLAEDSPPTPPPTAPPTTPPTTPPGTIAGVSGGEDGGRTGSPSPGPSTTSSTGTSGGNDNTCTLTGDSVDCGSNDPGTDSTQQVPQGQTNQQLAETGSDGTLYLLVGAATMIAGGVGFRLTPRLAQRRTDG